MTNPNQDPEQPFQANAYAPPTAPLPDMRRPVDPLVATVGQRIAGALLIANAVLVVLEMVILPNDPTSKDPFSSPSRTIVPTLIDVAIGVMLLAKNNKVVPWAILRVTLGLFLFVAIRIAQGDVFMVVMQILASTSLLLLLLGNAAKPRIAVASALFGVYGLLSFIGIGAELTGTNPIASLVQGASGQLESGPAGVVTGESSHYQLTAASEKWRLRTRAAIQKDNPVVDRWLTRPDVDAHVLVIAEKAPGGMVYPDVLADAVLKMAKETSPDLKVIDRGPLRTRPEDGRMLHTKSTVNGLAIESLTGVIGYYEHSFQIIAFAKQGVFPQVEAELRSIVESFKPPTDEKSGAPPDCEPNPVTRVEGIQQKYVLTAPSEGWYLRRDEIAKKDNSLADRWIVRPDLVAAILVVAENVPNAVIDIDKYTDAVVESIKGGDSSEVLSREPLATQPKIGRVVHAKATADGQKFEYLYGVFADGPRAFQIVAFADARDFAKSEADFRKAIEGFQLPPNNQP